MPWYSKGTSMVSCAGGEHSIYLSRVQHTPSLLTDCFSPWKLLQAPFFCISVSFASCLSWFALSVHLHVVAYRAPYQRWSGRQRRAVWKLSAHSHFLLLHINLTWNCSIFLFFFGKKNTRLAFALHTTECIGTYQQMCHWDETSLVSSDTTSTVMFS